MRTYLLGDVHGKISKIPKLGDNAEIIALGDVGWSQHHCMLRDNYPNVKVLLGNHDDPECAEWPHSLGHYGMYKGMFFVRGADSIDQHLRTEELDWFPNEQLTYVEMRQAFDLYCQEQPEIVLSHDCPQTIANEWFGIEDGSGTRQMLETMWRTHAPKYWFFGHHHQIRWGQVGEGGRQIDYTFFRCLDELELVEITEIL